MIYFRNYELFTSFCSADVYKCNLVILKVTVKTKSAINVFETLYPELTKFS